MGALDRFEKGVERVFNGAFARVFRSEVQPVEIASALRRECDDKAAIVGRDRTIVPNMYVVDLGPADHQRLSQWSEALVTELSTVLRDHVQHQQYSLMGPISIAFEESDDLDTGLFRIRSSNTRAEEFPVAVAPAPAPMTTAPTGHPELIIDGNRFPLTAPRTVIGRTGSADIAIDDAGASRRHAEIHVNPTEVTVVDLGSTNGTFVDGERIQVARLRPGSTITIGRTRLIFQPAGTSTAAQPGQQW